MPSGSSRASGSWRFARTPTLSLSVLLYLTLAFTSSVLAQQNVQLRPTSGSNSFPACGVNCGVLSQADDACTPPTAQSTNRQTYVSCFCQSSLLGGLRSDTSNTCSDTCTSSQDRQKIKQWYTDFCNSGGKTGSSNSNSNSQGSNNNNGNGNNNNSNGNNNNNGASPTPGSAADNSSAANRPAPQSWSVQTPTLFIAITNINRWDGHYQWVIMVIVLAVAFTAIAVGGVWLKRRHDRKHPNLYHAAQGTSDSRFFQNSNHDSLVPALAPPARSVNTVSFASSSRTNVPPPNKQGPSQSPLREAQGADNDVEIREVPR